MKNPIQLIVFLITVILFAFSCNENPLEPEENYPPGNRNYTWQADTIEAYFVDYYGIWGDTVTNVWAVSQGGSAQHAVIKYDGERWNFVSLPSGMYSPIAVFGFGNDIWFGQDEGKIWHYSNGNYINEFYREINTSIENMLFIDICGTSKTELYATGSYYTQSDDINFPNDGIIYKYNGHRWSLDKYLPNNGFISKIKYSSRNDKYYLLCFPYWGFERDTNRLYEYDGNTLKMIYNKATSPENSCTINEVNGEIYVTIGKTICSYLNNDFGYRFEVNDQNFGGQIWGRNKNDILIRMYDGLCHYNGTNIEYILRLPNNLMPGNGFILKDDFFYVTFDNNTGLNIIYRGTIKKE